MTFPTKKPILCLDFDGVLHSYTSGWKGIDVIPDPPVEGAMEFLVEAAQHFDVQIFSSRSSEYIGIQAMYSWVADWLGGYLGEPDKFIAENITFPLQKPPALVTIDDRAITFGGTFPDIDTISNFKPWNKK